MDHESFTVTYCNQNPTLRFTSVKPSRLAHNHMKWRCSRNIPRGFKVKHRDPNGGCARQNLRILFKSIPKLKTETHFGLNPQATKVLDSLCIGFTYWTLLHSRVIDGTPTVSGVAQTKRELFERARCRIKAQLSHRSANPVNPTEVSSEDMTTNGVLWIETRLKLEKTIGCGVKKGV